MASQAVQELEARLAGAAGIIEEVDALNALAAELVVDNIDRAEQLAQRALSLSSRADPAGLPYGRGLALSSSTLGSISKIRCDYRMALPHLLEAQALLEELHEREELLNVLRDLGWVYFNLGDLPQAIEILHKALRFARELGDAIYEAKILNALGAIYGENGDKTESIDALRRALTNLETADDNRLRCLILNNLAMTQFEVQSYNEALDSAAESLMIAKSLQSADLVASVLDTIGQIYLARQEYVKAESFFNQALASHHGEGTDPGEIKLNLARAEVGQGQLDEAAGWLHQSLASVEARGVNRFTYQVHELLSHIYEEKGELDHAINHYKLFHGIKSQVFNEETQLRLGNLMVSQQAETTRIDSEIYRLKNLALRQEISHHRQAVAEMEILATTDALTGLLNRRHFMTLAGYAFDSASRAGQPLSAIMIDIDDFKKVNDSFGHLAGDQVLIDVCSAIQGGLRKEDLLGRLGGEEFAAILPRAGLSSVQKVAERILQKVSAQITSTGGQNIQVTISIGLAQAGPALERLEQLLDQADQALYAAKRAGKNRVVALDPDSPSPENTPDL
ncbi:MAG TPA: diguanylate cyclase [Anaerolineaceae bacterium]|nr:diguanylate cyclase [Anaerolineaceae bacterium]